MATFTIKGYKVNTQTASMTAPNGQKYELKGMEIPVHYYDEYHPDRCFINLGTINDHCSVNGYRLPVPEDLELTGEYLDKFNESVAKWKSENQKWFSKKYQFSRKIQYQKVPTQWDSVETYDVTLWFHPLWVQWDNRESRDGTWWDYNVAKGLESPTNDFMDAAIASDLRYYQRLQWINDPDVVKASLVEAKKMFKSNIAPLIESFIKKIESGEYAREQKETRDLEERKRIEQEAWNAKIKVENTIRREKEKTEQQEKIQTRKIFLDKVKDLFATVKDSRVFVTPYSWDEITVEVERYQSKDTKIFKITNKAGVLRMYGEYSTKPIRKTALD